ncbi:MAG: cytochrome c3 family protein [Gammaproteobacteria bacterium]|nr:cytochrome c3 family protein [Gammaproteobacteria bacterium]
MTSPTLAWEFAQALGLGAVAGSLILCMLAVRPRTGAGGVFALRSHQLLGWLVLAAAVMHVAGLLAADRTVVEHVKPAAPRYEYAGALALVLLLFLTVPAGAALRSRLWRTHRGFQAAHVAAACLLVAALAVHVVTTGRYVHGGAQTAAYLLLSAVVLLALLRSRPQRQSAPAAARFPGGLVFGRHSRRVLAIVLASLAALLALARVGAPLALRVPFVARSARLALDFPHDRHRAVSCVTCHHDYIDRSGQGSCVSCHRSGRVDLKAGPEARFHDFCLGCHRDVAEGLGVHGPVTGCDPCHVPPGAPISFGAYPLPPRRGVSRRDGA